MEYLKVRIIFRSGRITELESKDYYKGQFRQWVDRNFKKDNGETYDWIVWNDFMTNVNEIEKVEEIINI